MDTLVDLGWLGIPPNGGLVRKFPPNVITSGFGIIVICPDGMVWVLVGGKFGVKLSCYGRK